MARVYAIDRRVYIGEDARPMYNAAVFGMQLYYVPADDLAALGRRRLLSQAPAAIFFMIVFIGPGERIWSLWWVVAAMATSPLAAACTGGWVTERYQQVTDPGVLRSVQQRAFQDSDPIVAVCVYFAFMLPDSARWIQRTGGRAALALVLVSLALQLAAPVIRSRERRRLRIEGQVS